MKKLGILTFCLGLLLSNGAHAISFSDRSHDWTSTKAHSSEDAAAEACISDSTRFAEMRARSSCSSGYTGNKNLCNSASATPNVQHSYTDRYTSSCTVEVTITVPDVVPQPAQAAARPPGPRPTIYPLIPDSPQPVAKRGNSSGTASIQEVTQTLASRLIAPVCGQRAASGRLPVPTIEFNDDVVLLGGLDANQTKLADVLSVPRFQIYRPTDRQRLVFSANQGDIQLERAMTFIENAAFEQNVVGCDTAAVVADKSANLQIATTQIPKFGAKLKGLIDTGILKCAGTTRSPFQSAQGKGVAIRTEQLSEKDVKATVNENLARLSSPVPAKGKKPSVDAIRLSSFDTDYSHLFRVAHAANDIGSDSHIRKQLEGAALPYETYSYLLVGTNKTGDIAKVQIRYNDRSPTMLFSSTVVSCER